MDLMDQNRYFTGRVQERSDHGLYKNPFLSIQSVESVFPSCPIWSRYAKRYYKK